MRRRVLAAVALVSLVSLAGAGAWYRFFRPEPPAPPPVERGYKDIEREEYEAWMRELGYTE